VLEEPPGESIFFLVSQAPGRLLPTIRSRCRLLTFGGLSDVAMTSALAKVLPERSEAERTALVRHGAGSVGQALAFSELDLAPLEAEGSALMREGDRSNVRRSKLSQTLSGKAASARYAAFLELLPKLVARHAREVEGPTRQRTLAAYEQVRDVTAFAPRHSLDPAATLFQLGTILASVADEGRDG